MVEQLCETVGPERTHLLRPWIWAVAASANWWVEWTTFMDAVGASPAFPSGFLGPRVSLAFEMRSWKLVEAVWRSRIGFVDRCKIETQRRTGNGYNECWHEVRGL